MARSFGNTDDVTNSLYAPVNHAGTISVWVKPNWNSGDSITHLFWNNANGDTPSFQRFSDNNIYAGFTTAGNSRIVIADTGLFTSGVWAHWTYTWSVSAGQTLYKNGVSVGTQAFIDTTRGTGYFIGAITSNLNASMADYAEWTTVLTLAEVKSLATGARPVTIREPSLTLWLPLDGIQSPEPDLSGFVHDGTLTGTTKSFGPPFAPFTPRWPTAVLPATFPPTFTLMPQILL